jgi:shikimate dehydrogenase
VAAANSIAAIAGTLSNRPDLSGIGRKYFAAVIGDSPSQYSRSPALWNAAFRRLGIEAAYLPFDVDSVRLPDLLNALAACENFLGANVTVPHKLAVMECLDSIDPGAQRIRAVNTIVRTPDGKLIGYNTDGEGFLASLLKRQPDRSECFLRSLADTNVLLIGAGGSARAVAFHAAGAIAGGKLLLCNRTVEHAASLAREIQHSGKDALAIGEEQLPSWAPRAGLIVNSTTKGQGGLRRLADGAGTFLEPYSALSAAHPPVLTAIELSGASAAEEWRKRAQADIERNNAASIEIARTVPRETRFYDLVYHPEMTVFLRHAGSTGHAGMNGKAMIINQAALAFCECICQAELRATMIDTPRTYDEVLAAMYSAW